MELCLVVYFVRCNKKGKRRSVKFLLFHHIIYLRLWGVEFEFDVCAAQIQIYIFNNRRRQTGDDFYSPAITPAEHWQKKFNKIESL